MNATINCLVTNIIQNIFLCSTNWLSKRWQNISKQVIWTSFIVILKHNFSFFWWVRYLLPNTCLWFGCIKVFLFFSQLENYTPSLPLVPLVFVCREWWWAVRECGLWRRCWNTTPVHWRQACSPITAHALRLNHKQQLTYRRHSQKPRPKHFSIPTLYLTLQCVYQQNNFDTVKRLLRQPSYWFLKRYTHSHSGMHTSYGTSYHSHSHACEGTQISHLHLCFASLCYFSRCFWWCKLYSFL